MAQVHDRGEPRTGVTYVYSSDPVVKARYEP